MAGLLILTFTTGLVDAVSVLGLGNVFTANMTGNVILLGFAIAGASGFSVAASLLSVLAFTLGAVVGARIGWLGARGGAPPAGSQPSGRCSPAPWPARSSSSTSISSCRSRSSPSWRR